MVVVRVKHLLLACFLSVVFIYFASNPDSNKIPGQVKSGIKGDIPGDRLNNNGVSHDTDDAIEKFIDRYISEHSTENLVFKEAAGGTTEDAVVYVYYGDGGDSRNGRGEERETKTREGDEVSVDQSRDELDLKTSSSFYSSSAVYGDTVPRYGKEITTWKEPPVKDLFLAPELKENPADKQEWLNPTGNFNGLESKSSTAAGPEPLTLSPPINMEEKRRIKDSPIVVLKRDSYWPPVLQPSGAEIFSTINYTKFDPEERAYLVGRVGVYEERARVVGEVCRNNPHLISVSPVHTFVWDQRHEPNIVWCEISKVASTSWMANFLRLGHYRENDTSLSHLSQEERDAIRFETQLEDDNLHFRVLRLFPAPNTTKERSDVFTKALRFIIVRHPFSRLLSAYQDKMTSLRPTPPIHNFRQLQIDIIKRYRGNKTIPDEFDPQYPTFGEFVQYVIDSTAHLKTLKDWRKVVCWAPYWSKCGVCAHDFQLIIKLETMVDDEHFLVTLAGLRELDKVFEWRHSRQSAVSKEEFFRQLSTAQMQQLHERYLLDFQLFSYSIHQYLDLAYDAPKKRSG